MNKSILTIAFLLFAGIANSLFAQDYPPLDEGGIGLSPEVLRTLTAPQPKHNSYTTRCKGAFLRTKVVNTKKSYKVAANLTIVEPFQQPALKLERQEYRIYTEVRLYEMLLRIFTPGEDENHGTYDYQRLDGEVWEGETSERTVLHGSSPLKNIQVNINGITLMTDDKGVVLDPEIKLDILGSFDDLGTRKVNFFIEAPEMEPVDFPMNRTMPKRQAKDDRGIDEEERYELLVALGLDFALSKGEPEQDALQIKAILPTDFAYAQAGTHFPLKLQVKNPSTRQTSCLIARTFSRCPGLNGKLFYFGAVRPGETKEFTRMIVVDKTEKSNTANLEIRFSDSWGILQQNLPLTFTVIH